MEKGQHYCRRDGRVRKKLIEKGEVKWRGMKLARDEDRGEGLGLRGAAGQKG